MTKKKMISFLTVMTALLIVSALGVRYQDAKRMQMDGAGTGKKLTISAESGFYSSNLEVKISVPKGAQVYYTLNAEEPSTETGRLYESAIHLDAPENEIVYVLRAKAFYADGTESEVETRTFFCGESVMERYHSYVLNITGDPEGLFGYENGIFVPGIRYDQFLEEHPDAHPGGGVNANYTMRGPEAEREVRIEMFTPSGEEILSQNGGVRIQGEASRMNNQKSFRLYARKEYDSQNEFKYPLFGDLHSVEDHTLGAEYKRLILRNSGQDYGTAFVRNELVGRLANQAGFLDTQHAESVCVYINGIYQGSYWLVTDFDNQYFTNRSGENDGTFVVLEGSEKHKNPTEEEEASYAEEFNAAYDRFAAMDMTVDENYEELQTFLDVENYLQYYAIENYVGNLEWPACNYKTYRYVAGESGYREGTTFDGRYRMILFDMDYSFGLEYFYGTIGSLVSEYTLNKVISDKAPLFRALMCREDCREYFTSYTLDLMNGAMSAENVARQLDDMHASRREELYRMIAVEDMIGGLLLDEEPVTAESVEEDIRKIKNYAEDRPRYVLMDLEDKFDYRLRYSLSVNTESVYSRAKVNTVYCEDRSFTGVYLKELPVVITPCVAPNERFSHWIVDGEKREEEQLILQGTDLGDSVSVELVTIETESPRLQIASLTAKGHDDSITLINLSSRQISTGGYYISDSDDAYQCALPALILNPGETLELVGKDNYSADSLGKFGLNFNLKQGEVVTLTYQEEQLDSVTVPKLSGEGVYERDFVRDIYIEKK